MHFVNAKGILSSKNGMNIYRGCTHGCIYCDSRSTCYQMKHDFEDIEVKINAPILLDEALSKKRRKCMIGTGAMCDPYMHCENRLGLTRKCLEVIERHGFGLAVQTKSASILRDLDLLCAINEKAKCVVQMTLTTYNEKLCRIIEPNVSSTKERVQALKILHENGIPTVVWLTPLLPYINDTEENLREIIDCAYEAGVMGIINFGFGVTLRDGDREYFYAALDRHFPGLKQRYIEKYGDSYECMSDNNDHLTQIFHDECEYSGIMHDNDRIFSYMSEFSHKKDGAQISIMNLLGLINF